MKLFTIVKDAMPNNRLSIRKASARARRCAPSPTLSSVDSERVAGRYKMFVEHPEHNNGTQEGHPCHGVTKFQYFSCRAHMSYRSRSGSSTPTFACPFLSVWRGGDRSPLVDQPYRVALLGPPRHACHQRTACCSQIENTSAHSAPAFHTQPGETAPYILHSIHPCEPTRPSSRDVTMMSTSYSTLQYGHSDEIGCCARAYTSSRETKLRPAPRISTATTTSARTVDKMGSLVCWASPYPMPTAAAVWAILLTPLRWRKFPGPVPR